MGKVVVVTGTDTGVGKTFVAAALCHALRQEGLIVRAVKPVESGVEGVEPGVLEDGVILARACGQSHPSAALQRFEAPLAPTVAARLQGARVDDSGWAELVASLAAESDVVVVEAAGGLLSPVSERFDARSLADHLGACLLVVGRDALGTINHTRLVLEAIGTRELAGVVLSAPESPDASTGRNLGELARAAALGRIISIGRFETSAQAAPALREAVPWLQRVRAT